jgi:hypothetical protein
VSTNSHLWSLTWATWIQSTIYHHTALISILIVSYRLRLRFQNGLFPSGFATRISNALPFSPTRTMYIIKLSWKSSPSQLYVTFEPSFSRVHIPVQCLLKSLFRPFACVTKSVPFIVFLSNAAVNERPAVYRLSMRQRCCGQGHDKMAILYINFIITT